ncbi:hypothetical protein M446_6462 [Methylobacterium sp. 4-46]|nr:MULTISPECIES: hypothetical protein [Methylobacterium]ACA20721.1 hypothetical protein M446_6462 [Methylobacterium sp. 4-46]WFT79876.1 hypothetical protein QA634_32615 [Methylobacterium nodulans]
MAEVEIQFVACDGAADPAGIARGRTFLVARSGKVPRGRAAPAGQSRFSR